MLFLKHRCLVTLNRHRAASNHNVFALHTRRVMHPSNSNLLYLYIYFSIDHPGECAESEEGVDSMDIDVIMKQLSVDRNTAVKALKNTGDVVDAIFEISNK